jgi:hypothetical protein
MSSRTGKNFSHANPNLELEPGVVLTSEIQDDLYINNADLQEEFLRQPELYAWWASTCELAKDLVAKQKFFLERLAANIDHQARMEAEQASQALGKPVKLTEKMVENTVIGNSEYQKAMYHYLELKKQLGMLQAGKDAIEQKKDMLISLGANYRAEASSNPSILMDAAKERARKAMAAKNTEQKYESVVDPTDNIPKKMPVGKKKLA